MLLDCGIESSNRNFGEHSFTSPISSWWCYTTQCLFRGMASSAMNSGRVRNIQGVGVLAFKIPYAKMAPKADEVGPGANVTLSLIAWWSKDGGLIDV